MSETQHNDAIDVLLEAVVDHGGPMTSIVAHMRRHQSFDAPPIGAILTTLLRPELEPLATRFTDAEIRAAARVIDAVTKIVCDEIYLVPDNRATRRQRLRR